jgi:low affinity Fe/Cu permease
MQIRRMRKPLFSRFADAIANGAGRPAATMLVSIAILAWLACGPWFHFGPKWELVISTGGTVVTLLMVFVIQHSQKNDSAALHIKLDEIISALGSADKQLLDLEKASPDYLEHVRTQYQDKARAARDGNEKEKPP